MTVTLVTHSDFARHLTGPAHPERPDRLRAVLAALDQSPLNEHLNRVEPEPVDLSLLTSLHSARYVEQVRRMAADGGGSLDPDTVVSPASYDVALLAAGGAVRAMEAAVTANGRTFALVRPPGHHARPAHGMGFCLFNNVACAAEAARHRLGRNRIFILDWDVHHGNGTQEIFYRRGDVLLCSLHQESWYPGTGAIEETGEGDGAGCTVNIPLPAGTGDEGYRLVFEEVVLPVLGAFAPDLVLISAGYDAHHADPLGGMLLSAAGFGALTRLILAHHAGPVAAVLEGGYDLPGLGRSVAATLAALAGVEAPAAEEAAPEAETAYATLRSRVREVRHVLRGFWTI